MSADQLSPAQQTFIKSITDQVNTMLGSQLPGQFQMVSYPPGFYANMQYSQPPVSNANTLTCLDRLLTVGSNGNLTFGDASFSGTYFKILTAARYQYSPNDNKVVQDPAIEAQQSAVTQEATASGFLNQFPVTPVTYYNVCKAVITNFGAQNAQTYNQDNINAAARGLPAAGFASLAQAISSSINQLGPLIAIQAQQDQYNKELAAATNNTQNPSATNGGLQTSPVASAPAYAVAYKLPETNQVLGGLQSGSKVTMSISVSNFSSTSTQLSIQGQTGFTVPILDFMDIDFHAGASYNLSKYTQASSSLDMTVEYPGVYPFQADPLQLSKDYTTGWYDQTLLDSIVTGSSNPNISGFKIDPQSMWNIPDTFGPGKTFSRLKTFVISQYPTITMTFTAGNSSAIESDFQQNASLSVKLFGLFNIGSASESYKVQQVNTNSAEGTVTVTLAPPNVPGTVSAANYVCYLLGGVADYPA